MLHPAFALAALAAALVMAYLAYRGFTQSEEEASAPWQAKLAAMGRRVRDSGGEDQRRALQARLHAAGLRDPDASDLFIAVQMFSVAAISSLSLIAGALWVEGLDNGALIGIAAIAVGYLLPLKILDARGEARRHEISKALPGAVDLLVTTIEAGLSVDQALIRIGNALGESDAALADELGVTVREIEAGIPLDDAMRRLGRRVGLEELQALCAVIAQASLLGARIGQSLRDYSDASRRQRLATLEERAGKLSARLTLPIVFCLLPSCLLLMLAPAVVEAIRAFGDVN